MKKWQAHETDFLMRQRRNRVPVRLIAVDLRRSEYSVKEKLLSLGMSRPRDTQSEWEPILRRMHTDGALDREIAKVLGCSPSTARYRRKLLRLPASGKSNPKTAARIKKDRLASSKKAMRGDGFSRLSDYLCAKNRIEAAARDWQIYAATPREADALDALESGGMTCSQLGRSLSVSRRRAAQLVGKLHNRGHLVVTGHRKSVRGGKAARVFALADGVCRLLCALREPHKESCGKGAQE